MKFNIDMFSKPKDVLVPFISEIGYAGHRMLKCDGVENKWYKVTLGDEISGMVPADEMDLLEYQGVTYRGYAFNEEFIPSHFNVFKQQTGLDDSSFHLYLSAVPSWSVVKVIIRPDKKIVCVGEDQTMIIDILLSVRERFDKDENLEGLKGVTPELRYLYFLCSVERDTLREMERIRQLAVVEAERQRQMAEFLKTLPGRLQLSIERAGGKLIRFAKAGKGRLEVTWEVDGERLKSIIREDTFQCLEAGFCVSGDDKKLNIAAAVLTAKDHIERDVLFKMRD